MSRIELWYFKDTCLYLRLEESHLALELLLALEKYDERGNIRWYNMWWVHLVEVTEDWGDHSDVSSEEMEEYQELLRQLEQASKEERDDPSKAHLS